MTVRPVRRTDLDQVIALDAQETGLEKRDYWERVYKRYGRVARGEQSWFLVAVTGSEIVGFVIGEVRDWEFGSSIPTGSTRPRWTCRRRTSSSGCSRTSSRG